MCFVKHFNTIFEYSEEVCGFIAPPPEIAKEDIVCYKIFRHRSFNTIVSLIQGYVYQYNKINTEIKLKPDIYSSNTISIEEGYHSYISKAKCKATLEEWEDWYITCKCLIPKGSEYYFNNKEEYISSNIIVLDERKWWQKINDFFNSLI